MKLISGKRAGIRAMWMGIWAGVMGAVAGGGMAQAVPHVVPYIGYLEFTSGAAYDGTIGQLDVALWDTNAPVPGVDTPLWTDSLLNVPVQSGVLSLTLGTPSNPLTPALFNQPGSTLWLSFELDGVPLAGLQRISSVPYALRAGDADQLGGLPAASWVTATSLANQGYVKADGSVAVTGNLQLDQGLTVTGSAAVGDTLLLGDGASGCGPASEGALRYNSTDKRVELCDGTEWTALGAAAPAGGSGTQSDPAASCQALLDAIPTTNSGNYWIDPDGAGTAAAFETYCLMTSGQGWTLLAKVSGTAGESWKYDAPVYTDAAALNAPCLLDGTNCDAKALGWATLSIAELRVELPGEGTGIYTLTVPGPLSTMFGGWDPNTAANSMGTAIAQRTGGTFAKYNTAFMGTADESAPTDGASDRCRLLFTSETSLVGPGLTDNNTNSICVGRVRGVSSNVFLSYSSSVTGNHRADLARFANGGAPTLEGPLRIFGR